MRQEKLHDIHNLLHRMRGLRERVFAHEENDFPMPTGQGRVLHCLWHHQDIAQHELAALLDIRPSSLSELLGKLENSGYVERVKSERDRRITHVQLTKPGREFFQKQRGRHEQFVEGMFAVLSDREIAELHALLQKLTDAWENKFNPPV